MAQKNWISKVLSTFQNSETKELNQKLQLQLDDLKESLSDYEVKFLDTEPSGFNTHYSADFSGIDQQIDAAALQRIYTTETWVYSAVSAIAQDIAMLPWKLEKKQQIKKKVTNEITGMVEEVTQDYWVDASSEKIFKRFQFPNPFCSRAEFLMMLIIDLETTGEFYIYLDAEDGIDLSAMMSSDELDTDSDTPFSSLLRAMTSGVAIKGMYRIPPPLIKPVPSESGAYIEGYQMQSDKGAYAFDFAEIIHTKLPNPNDPYRGQSPLVASLKPVLLDRFSTEHMVRFYKTGARLGGVITTEKSLVKEQLARFQRSFEDNFTGRKNHHRTLILPPGMKYTTIEQNPGEVALLEFCKYNREAILSVYRVPPIKVGIMDGANYANARVQLKTYFTDTIKPLLSFVQDGFNLKSSVFPVQGLYRIVFDLTGVEALREDFVDLATAASAMLNAGLTVNEVRKKVWNAPALAKGDRCVTIATIDKMENGQAGAVVMHSAEPGDIKDGMSTGANPGLIHTDVAGPGPENSNGKRPCEKCKCEMIKEPSCACECHDDGPAGKDNKQSLAEYISEALAKLDPSEAITPEFLSDLVNLYNQQNGTVPVDEHKEKPVESTAIVEAEAAPTQGDIVEAPKVYAFGMGKEQVVAHWKSFISKTDPLVEKRHAEVVKWFKKVKSHIANKLGINIKQFGLHKSRDEDDVDEILDPSDLNDLIKQYVSEIDATLKEAYESGYNDTLVDFVFGAPNVEAAKFLEKYGASEVTQILDTTRDQMKTLLADAFKEGVAVGEVSLRLQEKFEEISAGRAMTIARTETLTAVSQGQEQKRQDFQKQFPEKVLMKSWISAQDERVRDSHDAVDGESVGIDEEFSNGMSYPREPGGDASEVINCRCTTITHAEEQQDNVDSELDDDSEDSENQSE